MLLIPAAQLLAALAFSRFGPQDSATRPAPVVLDPKAVESWMDARVGPALEISGIPGAIVVVVQRSGVVLNKGYGVADLATGTKVDPDRTLFNVASIGKSMTGIIVAQLLEEGVLRLDEDANHYLTRAKINGPAVTLRMLLAHRGGFDDDLTGLLVPFDADIKMSTGELERRLHPLVRPGIATAYDNFGFGVIGLLLEDVTHKSIPELYRERLFEPAGMTGTAHGRPTDGKARLAHCYTVQGPKARQECEYWLYREALMGAGGVAASGADMARYLRLLLNGGTLDGRVVLSPAGFANLTNFDHIRFNPGMPGGGLAFVQFEEFRGLEYAHSGHIPGFSSMLKVYPDADVGIYVTFLGGTPGSFDLTVSNVLRSLKSLDIENSAKPGFAVMNELTDSFPAYFIPATRPRSSEGKTLGAPTGGRLDDFLGTYVFATNHSRSFVSRISGWVGTVALERAGTDGVRLGGPYSALGDYRPIGPLLYENARHDRLALAMSEIGPLMAVGSSGGILRRTNAWESPGWSVPLFLVSFLVLLTGLIQARRSAPERIRRLARRGLLGLGLALAGLLAEWQWGITLGIGRGAIVRPALWRLTLYIGLVILGWEAIRYVRTGHAPMGKALRAHGWLLAVAGLLLVVAVAVWRVRIV
jgi:CubicO group peptidase (beta-lactamase class C family)